MSCHPTRLRENIWAKGVRTGKGFIAGKVQSTGSKISRTVQAAVEDSRTGIP